MLGASKAAGGESMIRVAGPRDLDKTRRCSPVYKEILIRDEKAFAEQTVLITCCTHGAWRRLEDKTIAKPREKKRDDNKPHRRMGT